MFKMIQHYISQRSNVAVIDSTSVSTAALINQKTKVRNYANAFQGSNELAITKDWNKNADK